MKHTAGPWKIKWKDNVVSESERLICNCAGHQCNIGVYEIDEENKANARLIAAAPEQNKALNDVVRIIENYVNSPNDLRVRLLVWLPNGCAAIAKAEGK